MELFDDYQDDVERLTHDQIEAILSGEGHSSSTLTTLIRDIRLDLLEEPSPEIAARHLAAMARASRPREVGSTASRAPGFLRRRVLSRRRLTAMVLAAALLLVAGLAAAMTLPKKAAEPAHDTVPSTAPSVTPTAKDLPPAAAHGQGVASVATDHSLIGCEKGQAVSDIASAKGAENRKGPAKRKDPCDRHESRGKSESGRRGDDPTGPHGGSRGRDDSHPGGGAGPANAEAPGLGADSPGLKGSEAGGNWGGRGPEADRGRGVGGPGRGGGLGGSGVGGGVPQDPSSP